MRPADHALTQQHALQLSPNADSAQQQQQGLIIIRFIKSYINRNLEASLEQLQLQNACTDHQTPGHKSPGLAGTKLHY